MYEYESNTPVWITYIFVRIKSVLTFVPFIIAYKHSGVHAYPVLYNVAVNEKKEEINCWFIIINIIYFIFPLILNLIFPSNSFFFIM